MIKKILFLALAAVLMTACAFSLPGKFTQLADKVAAKGADYTPAQWEKANAQFEALVNQYVDKYDKLSNEDKKEINAAIGKYTATPQESPERHRHGRRRSERLLRGTGTLVPDDFTKNRPSARAVFLLPRREIIRIFDGPSFP